MLLAAGAAGVVMSGAHAVGCVSACSFAGAPAGASEPTGSAGASCDRSDWNPCSEVVTQWRIEATLTVGSKLEMRASRDTQRQGRRRVASAPAANAPPITSQGCFLATGPINSFVAAPANSIVDRHGWCA